MTKHLNDEQFPFDFDTNNDKKWSLFESNENFLILLFETENQWLDVSNWGFHVVFLLIDIEIRIRLSDCKNVRRRIVSTILLDDIDQEKVEQMPIEVHVEQFSFEQMRRLKKWKEVKKEEKRTKFLIQGEHFFN